MRDRARDPLVSRALSLMCLSCLSAVCLFAVELRAAGGWVRDKLLGLSSTDIDIAIDTTTGTRFARMLNK